MDVKIIGVIIVLSIFISGCVESKSNIESKAGDAPPSRFATTPAIYAPALPPTPAPTIDKRYIFINFSATKRTALGMYTEAPQGKVFLILTLDIKNNGYEHFSTNPFNWAVEINKVRYPHMIQSYELRDELSSVDLLDGGSIKGSLAFEVPADVDLNNYGVWYSWGYGEGYNLIWYKP